MFQLKGVEDVSLVEKHLEYFEDRPFNDLRYLMDSSKLRQLGWQPKVSWETGITQTSEGEFVCLFVYLIIYLAINCIGLRWLLCDLYFDFAIDLKFECI